MSDLLPIGRREFRATSAGAAAAVLLALATLPAQARAQRPSHAEGDSSAEEGVLGRVLARQFARYPRMGPQDVYKLIYQAAMGSRHAGLDSAMAASWLGREIATLAPGPEEPIVDTIAPDGRMVRVNLRPYLAAGGSRTALLAAFVRTARAYAGSEARLRRDLGAAERLAGAGTIPLPRAELHRFFERMRIRGYPAVEHSAIYESAYHPAYRVVLLPFLAPAGFGEAP